MATAHIEFNNQYVPQNVLDIEHVGECAIEGSNNEGLYYYLVVKTSLGTTTLASCGPVVPDVTLLPDNFSTNLTRMHYNDDKVTFAITKWLNDRKGLTEAKIIPIEDALSQFRDLGEYLSNYSDEVY